MILRARQKLIRKAGEVKRDLLFRMTGAVDTSRNAPGSVRVLVYHGVVPSHPSRFNTRFISCDLFEQHLRLFSTHCNLLSYDELKTGKTAKDKLNVLLTFDDGYANNFDYALPLLKKYTAPALFFVTAQRGENWLFNDVMDIFPSVGPGKITLYGKQFFLRHAGAHKRYVDENGRRASELLHSLNATEREKVLEQVFSISPREKFRPFGRYLDLMDEGQLKKFFPQQPVQSAHMVVHMPIFLYFHIWIWHTSYTRLNLNLAHLLENRLQCWRFHMGSTMPM